jgi:hypothetical protein
MAVGVGYLWMFANGGVSNRRPARPTDFPYDEIVQCHLETGKTIQRYRPPWPGGSHGIVWVGQTNTLWLRRLGPERSRSWTRRIISECCEWFRCNTTGPRAGQEQRRAVSDVLERLCDPQDRYDTRKVLEIVTLTKDDPDPHGTCLHDRHLYYCDAGFPVGSNVSNDPNSGWICRIDLYRRASAGAGLLNASRFQTKISTGQGRYRPQRIARVARMERDYY